MNTKQLSIISAQYGLHSPQYNTALNEYVQQRKRKGKGKGFLKTTKKVVKTVLKVVLASAVIITSILGTTVFINLIQDGYERGDNRKEIIKHIMDTILLSAAFPFQLAGTEIARVAEIVKQFFDNKFKSLRERNLSRTTQGQVLGQGQGKREKKMSTLKKVGVALLATLILLTLGTVKYYGTQASMNAIRNKLLQSYNFSADKFNKAWYWVQEITGKTQPASSEYTGQFTGWEDNLRPEHRLDDLYDTDDELELNESSDGNYGVRQPTSYDMTYQVPESLTGNAIIQATQDDIINQTARMLSQNAIRDAKRELEMNPYDLSPSDFYRGHLQGPSGSIKHMKNKSRHLNLN